MITSESNAGLAKGVHPFGKVSNVAKKKDRGRYLSTMSIDNYMGDISSHSLALFYCYSLDKINL